MDLNSVGQFLDLIQDPEKYAAALQRMKDEQARINKAIETVGKVAEIESMHEAATVALEAATKKADEILAEAERVVEGKCAELQIQAQELAEKNESVTIALAAARDELKAIKAKTKELADREKQITVREADIVARTGYLDQSIADFNARAEKLRMAIQ
jgi:chromosome segregation ATPase